MRPRGGSTSSLMCWRMPAMLLAGIPSFFLSRGASDERRERLGLLTRPASLS
jgi:hypothetical protein